MLDTSIIYICFSPFGPDLLPGMYSMPLHVVPKPNSSEFCLVTDHSFCPYSLNSMIFHDNIARYPLNNLKHLGEILLDFYQTVKLVELLIIFKSDISEAYHLLPVHKKWQVKQVNTIDGLHYIDHCNVFSNHAAGYIWIFFNALVLWIARYV